MADIYLIYILFSISNSLGRRMVLGCDDIICSFHVAEVEITFILGIYN